MLTKIIDKKLLILLIFIILGFCGGMYLFIWNINQSLEEDFYLNLIGVPIIETAVILHKENRSSRCHERKKFNNMQLGKENLYNYTFLDKKDLKKFSVFD